MVNKITKDVRSDDFNNMVHEVLVFIESMNLKKPIKSNIVKCSYINSVSHKIENDLLCEILIKRGISIHQIIKSNTEILMNFTWHRNHVIIDSDYPSKPLSLPNKEHGIYTSELTISEQRDIVKKLLSAEHRCSDITIKTSQLTSLYSLLYLIGNIEIKSETSSPITNTPSRDTAIQISLTWTGELTDPFTQMLNTDINTSSTCENENIRNTVSLTDGIKLSIMNIILDAANNGYSNTCIKVYDTVQSDEIITFLTEKGFECTQDNCNYNVQWGNQENNKKRSLDDTLTDIFNKLTTINKK